MKHAKYLFLLLGIVCLIAGFSAPHQFATAVGCLIMFLACLAQEKLDKEWEERK